MTRGKKIGLAILALLVLIQFIRPAKNEAAQLISSDDISKVYPIPEAVHLILIQKCYDCHSNQTHYPWYYSLQPVAWWMAHHVNEGKEHLNFSVFKTYPEKRASHKLEELSESINEGWMPLDSYTMLHPETKITAADRDAINAWLKTLPVQTTEHH